MVSNPAMPNRAARASHTQLTAAFLVSLLEITSVFLVSSLSFRHIVCVFLLFRTLFTLFIFFLRGSPAVQVTGPLALPFRSYVRHWILFSLAGDFLFVHHDSRAARAATRTSGPGPKLGIVAQEKRPPGKRNVPWHGSFGPRTGSASVQLRMSLPTFLKFRFGDLGPKWPCQGALNERKLQNRQVADRIECMDLPKLLPKSLEAGRRTLRAAKRVQPMPVRPRSK